MKKILIVDNNIDPPHGCPEIQSELKQAAFRLGIDFEIVERRAPDMALPKSIQGFSAAVLSGSKTRIDEEGPWIDQEMNLLRELHREQIPTLGICYGEQLMAKVFAGKDFTGVSKIAEYGWIEIDTLDEAKNSAVFDALPKQFYSFSFHSDEVYRLPKNFRLVAKSGICPVQAFDLLDAPMWGVQFHPERSLVEGNRSLERIHSQEPNRKLFGYEKRESLYDAKVAAVIFENFLKEMGRSGK